MDSKKEKPKIDHVALTAASMQKLEAWVEFVRAKKRGVQITRKDFVNWLIERLPEIPTASDINALVDRFYDEEALLRQLLRDVKRNKREGQASQIEVIVRSRKTETKREARSSADNETQGS